MRWLRRIFGRDRELAALRDEVSRLRVALENDVVLLARQATVIMRLSQDKWGAPAVEQAEVPPIARRFN